jgi:O-antigen/teichoic acid export membrane protein
MDKLKAISTGTVNAILKKIYKILVRIFPFLPKQIDVHFRELLKGSTVTLIIRLLGMVVTYFFTFLVTRNYGAVAMGIFSLSQTVLLIASIIAKLGLDSSSLRFVAEYSSQGKWGNVKEVYIKSLKLIIPTSIFVTCLFFFCAPVLSQYVFKKPYLSSYFKIMSLSLLPFSILFLHSESLRGLKKIVEYAIFRNMSIPFVASLVMCIALFFPKDMSVPVIAHVIGTGVLGAISLIVWFRHAKILEYKAEKSLRYKNILDVSLPLMLSSSMLLIMHWTDTIMLGIFRSETDVGIYNVAIKIANFTAIPLFAINGISAPKFAEFYGKGDMRGLKKVVMQSTKLIFWSSFPILLVFLFFPSFSLGLFGKEFKTGLYALEFLTIGQFVNAISGSVGIILQMTGKQKAFQNIMLFATVLNITLNVVLIPRYGINGAAFASMIAMAFWNLSSVIYVKSYLKIVTLYIPFLTRKRIKK